MTKYDWIEEKKKIENTEEKRREEKRREAKREVNMIGKDMTWEDIAVGKNKQKQRRRRR